MAIIKNMHYDYKQKLNKIDSFKNRNFQVPEIDWKLNEGMNIFIKQIAAPKLNPNQGVETSQRSIDSIRPLIIKNLPLTPVKSETDPTLYSVSLPTDYMHHLSSTVSCKKAACTANVRTTMMQHDDKEDLFYGPSFEWREIMMQFSGGSIILKTDGTFTVEKVFLTYIKLPKYMHNAADFVGGNYTLPDGTVLTGIQDCELPVDTLSEIVDIAVLITTGDLLSSYQLKQSKLQITN